MYASPNLARGLVDEVDAATHRVRCRLPDHDDMQTFWLQVLIPHSGADKVVWLPVLGEAVALLLDEKMEAGFVLGAYYTEASAPPVASETAHNTIYRDGATISYDTETHNLAVNLPADATITVTSPGAVTLTTQAALSIAAAGGVAITGDVAIDGALTATGNAAIDGDVSAGGDVSDSTRSMAGDRNLYNQHQHGIGGPATPQQ